MNEVEKKEFFDSHHQPFVDMAVKFHELLNGYAESHMKTYAKQKVDEAYLWCTQICHSVLAQKMDDNVNQDNDVKEDNTGT